MTTHPPLNTGDRTFLIIPPIWNRGIIFRQTSFGPRAQDDTMHPTPDEYGVVMKCVRERERMHVSGVRVGERNTKVERY